jgi:hypothetical protein
LLDTIIKRRSRRFALGAHFDGVPFTHQSRHAAVPLTIEEEAALVFAGAGITGYALGDLPFDSGERPGAGGGTIMISGIGRTIASPDAAHTATLCLLNDDGAFQIRRPQSFPKERIPELARLAEERRFVELYEQSRIRLADTRPDLPREAPHVPPFNKWDANVPGTTYFIPVTDVTALYLTLLFTTFGEEFSYFLYDERNGYRPAGIAQFGRSKGGHLPDDPNLGQAATIVEVESYLMELCAVEQGLMIQNMALVTEALGLGGFPHYGAQKYGWLEALGFTMRGMRYSELMNRGPLMTAGMNLLKKNPTLKVPLGLEVGDDVTIKPYCPPWYPSMEAAVHAFVDSKYSEEHGIFRGGTTESEWKDPTAVRESIPKYSDASIDAVVAYCEYVYGRYGRFLANFGPLRTLMAYQVHHIDTEFYDRYYKPGVYEDAHRRHLELLHDGRG